MKGQGTRKLGSTRKSPSRKPRQSSVPVYQARSNHDRRARHAGARGQPDHAEFNQRPNQQVVGTTALEERRAVRNTGGPNGIQGV